MISVKTYIAVRLLTINLTKVIKFINFVKSAVDADNSGPMERNGLKVFPIMNIDIINEN